MKEKHFTNRIFSKLQTEFANLFHIVSYFLSLKWLRQDTLLFHFRANESEGPKVSAAAWESTAEMIDN